MIAAIIRFSGLARAAFGWIADRPYLMGMIALAIVAGWRGVELRKAKAEIGVQTAKATQWKGDFLTQREEMRKFAALVRAARIQAAKDDVANVKRVEGEWSTKLEKRSNAYQSSLAAALADADRRMRSGGAASGGESLAGGSGSAELPRLSIMPSGPLSAGGAAIISRADALNCVARGKRLEALIAAWKDAASIDVNGATKKAPEAPLQLP
ncbi:hypothetical protein VVT58_15590 [Sphingobium sp. SJ10-10]|uniref:hypothetical protein n=1 Tax=Sphingobium sp. SJ10-10 TaxID=3114999 RepID=UPI002E185DEA|nr:hypothetical protein [Sphingobium sp. SJ10-10]